MELLKYFSSKPTLNSFDDFGNQERRRKTQKQVNVISFMLNFNHKPIVRFFSLLKQKVSAHRSNYERH